MYINEDALYQHIGLYLRRYRQERGITQAQLAKATGELRTSITNIEAGRQKPPLHVLYNLCAALRIEIMMILPSVTDLVDQMAQPMKIGGVNREIPPRTAAFLQELLGKGGEEDNE